MHVKASMLEIGDVIVEGRSETKVTEVDTVRHKGKVHVNGKDCYEAFADVKVLTQADRNKRETKVANRDKLYRVVASTGPSVDAAADLNWDPNEGDVIESLPNSAYTLSPGSLLSSHI
jgi:hypothetical protein